MIQAEQLHARILEELDLSRDIPDEELTELIHRVLDEASGREYIPLGKKAELGRELFNAFRKFDLLQEFLEDDKITEIMINGTENIFLEKEGCSDPGKGLFRGRSWKMSFNRSLQDPIES